VLHNIRQHSIHNPQPHEPSIDKHKISLQVSNCPPTLQVLDIIAEPPNASTTPPLFRHGERFPQVEDRTEVPTSGGSHTCSHKRNITHRFLHAEDQK
jgi:hypothetical protein